MEKVNKRMRPVDLFELELIALWKADLILIDGGNENGFTLPLFSKIRSRKGDEEAQRDPAVAANGDQ